MNPIQEEHLANGAFYFLSSRAPDRLFLSVVVGALGGLAYAALIPLILMSIQPDNSLLAEFARETKRYFWSWEISHPRFALAFLLLCGFVVVTRAASQILFNSVAIGAVSDLRLFISERVKRVPIAALEDIGSVRVMTALTVDIPKLVDGASNLPLLLIHSSTIIGALAFIAFLHVKLFVLVSVVIVLGVITYHLPLMLGERYFSRARESQDGIQEAVRGLVYGAKELKLNARKREHYMDEGMRQHESLFVRAMQRGGVVLYLAIQYGNIIGFLAIGGITYGAVSVYSLSGEVLVAVVMAMLYIIGPISIIANSIPGLIQGNIALRQLRQLLDDMPLETVIEEPGKAALSCDEIRLVNLSYVYGREDAFQIGPINLQFKRGQISFIVGGNGSGKSTLAKVISGHYQATQGEIWYDQQRINDSNLFCARQSVAAIYLDFYLFPRLFGLAAADLQKAQYYLEKLGLAHKVSLQGDRFSTIDLSDGQRKRLALLAAYLEDKNLYVFDEWAADQDPEFKRVFYTDLLPQFKRDGKIVVVISHDDRYFDQADQLIWMEHGKLLKVEQRSTALAA